jgi:hypothetical protein
VRSTKCSRETARTIRKVFIGEPNSHPGPEILFLKNWRTAHQIGSALPQAPSPAARSTHRPPNIQLLTQEWRPPLLGVNYRIMADDA